MDLLYDWKASFLQHVGVSGGLKGDFIGAISACWSLPLFLFFLWCLTSRSGASDATYHVMWVIVFDAVDDFGIKEVNDIERNHNHDLGPPQVPPHMDEAKARVFDEALRGASRIAGLVGFCLLASPPLSLVFTPPRLVSWNRTNIWSVMSSNHASNLLLNIVNQKEVRSCRNVAALPSLRLPPRPVRQARSSELYFWTAPVQLRVRRSCRSGERDDPDLQCRRGGFVPHG